MNVPKLTKNEIRFSKLIRPEVGDVVEFSPCIILCNGITARMASSHVFIQSWMVEGGKCEVVENYENTVAVRGVGCELIDIVSPEFLIKRDLTGAAMSAVDALRKALSITN